MSKEVSYALRHAPHEYQLEMNNEGWVSVDQLLNALNSSGKWGELRQQDLLLMMKNSDKRRHEIKGNKIRAIYGHSLPTKIVKEEQTPPPVLYHGTARRFYKNICRVGLLPQERQYVHMSEDFKTALSVGMRRDSKPLVLRIDAERANREGVKFYYGDEDVWLANEISSKYITIQTTIPESHDRK